MPKPTKSQLSRYVELRAKKSSLESEARSLETEIHQLQDVILTHMEDIGKDAAKVNGFHVNIDPGRRSVQWKNELVRVIGAEAVAEINENAPRGVQLSVKPA